MIETLTEWAPYGEYFVKIEDIKLIKISGEPILFISFVVIEGKYDQVIFTHTEIVKGGYSIDSFNQYLEKLESKKYIEFRSFKQYEQLLKDIKDEVIKNIYIVDYKKHPRLKPFDHIEIIKKLENN